MPHSERTAGRYETENRLFCDVEPNAVINNLTAQSIYEVPLLLQKEGLDRIALEKLGLDDSPCDMDDWKAMVGRILSADKEVDIALVASTWNSTTPTSP